MRIGGRHVVTLNPIVINNSVLKYCQEMNCLGVTIVSAKSFKLNLQNSRHKFFKALNDIFGKVGVRSSPTLTCSLVDHCCLPIIMYACESFSWTTSMFLSLDSAYFQAFAKILKSFDKNTIMRHGQFYMRCLPIELRIIEKKVKFLKDLVNNQNMLNLSFIDACGEL